jgi:hypothetical protein
MGAIAFGVAVVCSTLMFEWVRYEFTGSLNTEVGIGVMEDAGLAAFLTFIVLFPMLFGAQVFLLGRRGE